MANSEMGNGSLTDALISILYHSHPELHDSGTRAKAMSVDDALTAVADAQNEFTALRGWMSKLAVGNFSAGKINDPARSALDRVLGRQSVRPKPKRAVELIEEKLVGFEGSSLTRSEKEREIYVLLRPFIRQKSCASDQKTDTAYSEKSDSTLATYRIERVRRSLADAAAMMDPQNWQVTFKPYIAKSFIALRQGGIYVPKPGPGRKPGSTWSGVLFEKFMLQPYKDSWLTNFFEIHCLRTSDLFVFEYELHRSVILKLGGKEYGNPLYRNQGYVSVRRVAEELVDVSALKVLQYRPELRQHNQTAPLFLEVMGEFTEIALCRRGRP